MKTRPCSRNGLSRTRVYPGNVLCGSASLLTIDCEPPVRDEVSKGAERIKHYTTLMSRLVGDLLDVVSIGAGRFALSPRREDASALLLETVEVYQPIAAGNDISIRSEVKTGSFGLRANSTRAALSSTHCQRRRKGTLLVPTSGARWWGGRAFFGQICLDHHFAREQPGTRCNVFA